MPQKITLIIFAVLFVTGCAPHPAPAPPLPHPDPGLKIALTVQPASPRQMDPAHFTVALRDAHGKPVPGAEARMDLQMPSMDMGQDAVALSPQAAGVYTGTGRFTMSGDWRVAVTVTKGPKQATQSFPITVR